MTDAPTNGSPATTICGRNSPELAADAKRQAKVEQRSVEQVRPGGSREPEALGARGAAGLGCADQPVVELLLDRVPLLGEPVGQRQPVARPADEEDPRALALAHRAASTSRASSRP